MVDFLDLSQIAVFIEKEFLIKIFFPLTLIISSSCNFLNVRESVSVIVPRYAAIVDFGMVSFTNGSGRFSVPLFFISLTKYFASLFTTSLEERSSIWATSDFNLLAKPANIFKDIS